MVKEDLFGRYCSFEAFSSPSPDCTRGRREACGAHKQARLSLENILGSISQALAHYKPPFLRLAVAQAIFCCATRNASFHHQADSSKTLSLRLLCLII
jgi:hypothetical protein